MAQELVLKVRVEGDKITILEQDLERASKKFDKVEKSAKQTTTTLKDVGENGGAIAILDSLTGGLATKIRDAAEASKLFNNSLKSTRTALIATGIGAFVVALGTVVAYWDDTVDFITGANQELERQQRILQKQDELAQHQNELLRAKEGSLKRQGVSQTEYNNMLIDELENLIKIQEQELENEKRRLAELKAIREEGGGALEGFARMGAAIFTNLARIADEFFAKIGLDTGFQDSVGGLGENIIESIFGSKADLDEANQRVKDLELSIASARSEIANLKTENDQIIASQPKRGQVSSVGGLTPEGVVMLDARKALNEALINENANLYNELLLQEEMAAHRRMKLEEMVQQAKIHQAQSALGSLMGLMDQGSKAYKGLAIAQALLDTYQGVNAVFKSAAANPSTILFPGFPYIQAGLALAKGLATVKQITSTKVGSAAMNGGGGAFGAAGGGVPATPSFNIVGNTGINQLGDTIREQNREPARAYIVADDLERNQSIERNSQAASSLG